MNWIEAQIKTLQEGIEWHKARGLNCRPLEEDLEILLRKVNQ